MDRAANPQRPCPAAVFFSAVGRPVEPLSFSFGTLHDRGLLGVTATGEKDSSDELDLAKGTVR